MGPTITRLAFLGALLCSLPGGGFAASAQQGPDGDAFYTPPSPLPEAEHGTVIWTRPLTSSAALPSAARNLLVLYHSRDLEGRDIAVSGTVSIPQGTPPAGGWPLISWTHGTTGLVAMCAPSRDTPTGPEHYFLAMKQPFLDDYVKRGYVVVAKDYPGFGGPGLHPFMQGVAEGRGGLDLVRAARQIEPAIGSRYVNVGLSQGGHADLFASALGPDYIPEVRLLGNVAFAPASHLGETVKSMVTADAASDVLIYATYVLQSYASNHPDIDLSKILTPQAVAQLPLTQQECITKGGTTGFWATAIPKDQFLPEADLSAVLKVAAENEPATLRISVPTLLAQGTDDDTVLPSWTDEVARALCKNGTPLFYQVFPGATHETVMNAASEVARSWIEARFAGQPAASNCDALPFAGAH